MGLYDIKVSLKMNQKDNTSFQLQVGKTLHDITQIMKARSAEQISTGDHPMSKTTKLGQNSILLSRQP